MECNVYRIKSMANNLSLTSNEYSIFKQLNNKFIGVYYEQN